MMEIPVRYGKYLRERIDILNLKKGFIIMNKGFIIILNELILC